MLFTPMPRPRTRTARRVKLRFLADQTEGETHVQRERVENGQAALIAIDGRHLIDAAESAARCRPGLRGGETLFEELSRQQVEMTADLLVEPLVAFAPAENVRQARQEDFEGNHGSSHPSVDSQQDCDIAPVESQQGCGEGSGSDRLPRSWGGREQEVAKTTELTAEERRERRRNGEDAGRGRRHADPAESNHILFSVRPPLAPFLRCELRSLRPLRTGRAAKLTQDPGTVFRVRQAWVAPRDRRTGRVPAPARAAVGSVARTRSSIVDATRSASRPTP